MAIRANAFQIVKEHACENHNAGGTGYLPSKSTSVAGLILLCLSFALAIFLSGAPIGDFSAAISTAYGDRPFSHRPGTHCWMSYRDLCGL